MKNILHILADIALLPVSGCIFPGNRGFVDDWVGSEVHPQVNEINEDLEEMIAMGKENSENHPPAARQKRA